MTTISYKHLQVTPRNNDTWTLDALQRGDVDAIRQRVLEDPDYLASRDYVGSTPLLTAIASDHLELIQFLLVEGADPNVPVDDGYTCLLSAVESDSEVSSDIVATLISAGADIHQTGINGWTPLHMAAARGNVAIARLLIEAGAHIDQRTEIDGEETPLMEAAFAGQPHTVQLLLEHGADASLRDTHRNRTPREIARDAAKGPDPDVYNYLKKEHVPIDADAIIAEVDLPPEQMAMIKQSFENLDVAENYLQSARELAANGKHAEVIRVLTEHAARR